MLKMIMLVDKGKKFTEPRPVRVAIYLKRVRPDFQVTDYIEPKGYPGKCMLGYDELCDVLEKDDWEPQIVFWQEICAYSELFDEGTIEATTITFVADRIHDIMQEDYNKFTVWSEDE